tara:strand:- start:419 stop:1003 length:585 start_codon:yes stop_codon:yes gene_type:complete
MSKFLKGYSVDKFKSKKPSSNSSFDTAQEIKQLAKIPMNKKFVVEKDNVPKVFKTAAESAGVEYPGKDVKQLIKESEPFIMKLKNHFDRPRPKVIAKKMNIKLDDIELKTMKTPSYPSGHSVQGYLIGSYLADKNPKAKSAFMKAAKDISHSRNVAHAHYKSDSKLGDEIGKDMFKFMKQNGNIQSNTGKKDKK